jgi:hypothetical protein
MPALVAACRAVTDPAFHLNRVASLAIPWPLLIVNGPQVKTLKFNSGVYVFGSGTRANATVGRAPEPRAGQLYGGTLGGIQRGR